MRGGPRDPSGARARRAPLRARGLRARGRRARGAAGRGGAERSLRGRSPARLLGTEYPQAAKISRMLKLILSK